MAHLFTFFGLGLDIVEQLIWMWGCILITESIDWNDFDIDIACVW